MDAPRTAPLVCRAIENPALVPHLSPDELEQLLVEGRATDLLAKVHHRILRAGLTDAVPQRFLRHSESAWLIAQAQHEALSHELHQLAGTLAPLGVTPVLLKGAAYVKLGLQAAGGRTFSDIDLLVPRQALPPVESALMLAGWVSASRDAYDQRYYREWMHEIPPMQHIRRATMLDLHHAITPSTSRIRADSDRMLSESRATGNDTAWATLCPCDLVLHSATHLFLESEPVRGLRDLVDLRDLLVEFIDGDQDFIPGLIARARETGLTRPLFYAFRYLDRLLGYIPACEAAARTRDWGPGAPTLAIIDACMFRMLKPAVRPHLDAGHGLAAFCIYVRGHWLRMPLHLLLPHLLRKALMNRNESDKEADNRAGQPARGH